MTTDQLKNALRSVLQDGLEQIVDQVTDAARDQLAEIARDAAEAAVAGDSDTVKELGTQVLGVGEVSRLLALEVAREKFKVIVDTALDFAVKVAIALI